MVLLSVRFESAFTTKVHTTATYATEEEDEFTLTKSGIMRSLLAILLFAFNTDAQITSSVYSGARFGGGYGGGPHNIVWM